jgi:hypothetical protein
VKDWLWHGQAQTRDQQITAISKIVVLLEVVTVLQQHPLSISAVEFFFSIFFIFKMIARLLLSNLEVIVEEVTKLSKALVGMLIMTCLT